MSDNKLFKRLEIFFSIFLIVSISFVFLYGCRKETFTLPQIKLETGGSYKSQSDTFKVGDSLRYGVRCSSNGDAMLTRLFIHTSNDDTIDNLSIKPPAAAFGYDFSFKKTTAGTDSIIVELFDTDDNIGSLYITLHKKLKK